MPPRIRRELLVATIVAIIVAAVLQYVLLSSSGSRVPPASKVPSSGAPVAAVDPVPPRPVPVADFATEKVDADLRRRANWLMALRAPGEQDFILIDKPSARLYVFDAQARLRASTPVLLGSAKGDHTVPGIGMRPIADVPPEERTTPAGRFVAEYGRNSSGEDVVWVDYDAAVSMHRVRATNPQERRLERLASRTAADNRISWGCINVPAAFFDAHIVSLFRTGRPIVYILPEVDTMQATFGHAAGTNMAVSTHSAEFPLH